MSPDPNDPIDPNDPPVPEPAPEPPPAPQIDLEQAYDVIARTEGWDPRLTRYEIQEHKRRVQEFERERKEFERQRSMRYEPPEDNGDPYMREIRETRREVREFIEGQRAEKEKNERRDRALAEVDAVYISEARQAGMTKEQMAQRAEDFYAAMNDLYPDHTVLEAIGVERAARNAFRLLGNMPRQPQPYVNGRGRTASVVIPGAVTQAQAPVQDDSGPQRPGESLEDYVMRRRRWREENNVVPVIRDGQRYSSE